MKTEKLRRVAKHDYPKFEVGLLLDDMKGGIMFLSSLLGGLGGVLNGVGSLAGSVVSSLFGFLL
ncbi:MAG: hypothetical protein WCF33_25660 [Pseudonocardiaceae bacterium]